ncbi:hypothetical protein DL96DRAFT_1581570 [Flagelloscypha sp. PMI_526]|nr:hypothetical protein DL96DRAFT_1581570 [Flagelloscypha sp. PMI_526]
MTFAFLVGWLFSYIFHFVAAQSAPYTPNPFQNTGDINGMSLDGSGDPLAGGTITIDGLAYTIPKNTLVTLPSIAVAWPELFTADGQPNLPQYPTISWQAQVYGNTINGENVVGLIYIAQNFGEVLQGFVSSIDVATGHFRVAGSFGGSGGVECVLNDPTGMFGKPYTDHPLWTVDPENPSIRSSTGYPMCIPTSSDDPDCPSSQRPNGETKVDFAQAPVPAGQPDPLKMVPIVVGDYVTISATNVGNDLYAVYSLVANVGLYTAPGTQPAYITVEEAQYAVYAELPNMEDAEVRAVAFTTDPEAIVQWFVIDVDPCTGEESERNVLLLLADPTAPVGRIVARVGKSNFNPATREMGFRIYPGAISNGPKGLIAGQFIQPIMFDSFIMPELTIFGDNIPEQPFQHMDYLSQGSGPYTPGNPLADPPSETHIVGKLDPWPGSLPVAAPPTCDTSSALTTQGTKKKVLKEPVFMPLDSAVPSFDYWADISEIVIPSGVGSSATNTTAANSRRSAFISQTMQKNRMFRPGVQRKRRVL